MCCTFPFHRKKPHIFLHGKDYTHICMAVLSDPLNPLLYVFAGLFEESVLTWHLPPHMKCDTGESGAALGFSTNQYKTRPGKPKSRGMLYFLSKEACR